MEEKIIRIALAGNPNCGKTTLYNALTGSAQFVGNWPGVTVEKKEGTMKGEDNVILTDLPGIYSLSPYTPEEVVARDYLTHERPDVILNIVDGTNIERNLYLTTQLAELGIPIVIAVNMIDIVRKRGDSLDISLLSKAIGCPVTEISALRGTGIDDAARLAIAASEQRVFLPHHNFSGAVEHALAHIEEAILHDLPQERQRYYAIKIFEGDSRVLDELDIPERTLSHIKEDIKECEEELSDDAESIIINERYNYIASLLSKCYKKKHADRLSASERIDKIVTNRILALPIFIAVMWLVYTVSIGTIGDFTVSFMNDTLFGSWIIPFVRTSLESIGCASWLVSLVADGIIGGVGAVLGFVPQLLILFTLLCILEDIGYMARVAFIMDKLFRKFGLSGKSFIPMLVASGCGVPGIMASRTIESEKDRRMTVVTTGFIPCGAKMPIVGCIAGALFDNSPLIALSAYAIGVGAVIISGIMLKKTKIFIGDPSPFVMELPAYHLPTAKNVLRGTWERGWDFIKRAGTLIVAASFVIWVLNSFSFEDSFHFIGDGNSKSILRSVGEVIALVFVPLGFGSWQAAIATVLGLLAKEEVVGVFGSITSMESSELAMELAEQGSERLALIGQEIFGGSRLSGFSFMVFNLLCAPCFAAMGAIKREMNSGKWTAFAITYMCLFAYAVSLIIYQIGSAISGNVNIIGLVCALIVLAFMIFMTVRPVKKEIKI